LRIDARGQRTSYSYDPLNRQIGYIYNNGQLATFAFDPAGRQILMADWTGITSYSYDSDRRPTSVIYPTGKALAYAYDGNGNRLTLVDPDGGLTAYSYNRLNLLTGISNPFAELTTIIFDPLNREIRRTLANGVVTSHTFDAANRETARTQITAAGVALTAYTATYDAAGNRLTVAEIDGNRVSYTYDASYQLLSEQRSGPLLVNTTYTYDGPGNRLTMANPGAVTTYSYNAANAMTLIAQPTGARTTITFDANGNTLGENAGGALTTYTWDGENRLIFRADSTNGVLTSTYDGTGQRSQLVTPTATTLFVHDGQNVLIETNTSGITQAHYTDGPGSWGDLTSQRRSTASSFYGFDLSSNTRLLTSAAAASLGTGLTDAFGKELSITGSVVSPFWFSGQVGLYRDVANFLHARARFLDTVKGRWPNRDPSGRRGGDNLYGFVGCNPVTRHDPSGLYELNCEGCYVHAGDNSCVHPMAIQDIHTIVMNTVANQYMGSGKYSWTEIINVLAKVMTCLVPIESSADPRCHGRGAPKAGLPPVYGLFQVDYGQYRCCGGCTSPVCDPEANTLVAVNLVLDRCGGGRSLYSSLNALFESFHSQNATSL
jgi:RHS repeat-associated protein